MPLVPSSNVAAGKMRSRMRTPAHGGCLLRQYVRSRNSAVTCPSQVAVPYAENDEAYVNRDQALNQDLPSMTWNMLPRLNERPALMCSLEAQAAPFGG
jgi:hypothetical protein